MPALDLAALVQRHAAGFGRVRACGEWSERRFRQVAGPLLLAFARHVHLLPVDALAPPGSMLDAGLDACAQAVLAEALRAEAGGGVDRQEAVVLCELAGRTAQATGRWRASTLDGRPLDLHARPLADQLAGVPGTGSAAALPPRYRIEPAPASIETPAARLAGMVLLLRAAPACVLAAPRAAPGGLLEAALALQAAMAVPADASRLRATMDDLIAEGCWTLNQRRSRLWHLDGRLYLAWKTAARELGDRLALEPRALLDALARHRIVRLPPGTGCSRPDAAGALMSIRTPCSDALSVVELADPDHWLARIRPQPTPAPMPCATPVPAPPAAAPAARGTRLPRRA